jgi:uncharacterized protein HemX
MEPSAKQLDKAPPPDSPAPVMDVRRPAPSQETMATPPPQTDQPETHSPPVPAPKPAAKKPPAAKAKPATNSSVTAAIAATVIIVLGLAGLAVYAYLKQNQ